MTEAISSSPVKSILTDPIPKVGYQTKKPSVYNPDDLIDFPSLRDGPQLKEFGELDEISRKLDSLYETAEKDCNKVVEEYNKIEKEDKEIRKRLDYNLQKQQKNYYNAAIIIESELEYQEELENELDFIKEECKEVERGIKVYGKIQEQISEIDKQLEDDAIIIYDDEETEIPYFIPDAQIEPKVEIKKQRKSLNPFKRIKNYITENLDEKRNYYNLIIKANRTLGNDIPGDPYQKIPQSNLKLLFTNKYKLKQAADAIGKDLLNIQPKKKLKLPWERQVF